MNHSLAIAALVVASIGFGLGAAALVVILIVLRALLGAGGEVDSAGSNDGVAALPFLHRRPARRRKDQAPVVLNDEREWELEQRLEKQP